MSRVYATRADLVAFVPGTATVPPDPEATRLLHSASRRVDSAMKTAVYDVDSVTLLPKDAAVIEVFRDATCAQAYYWFPEIGGDETGSGGQFSAVSIGSVSLSRGAVASGDNGLPAADQLCIQAAEILLSSGLLPGVITNYY
jgi:hypothetical protein